MRRARVRHFVYMEIIRGCQMETITSRENAKIKYACRLREEEKLRTADGLFFAEGPKLCLELARGCTLQTLYATEKALAHTPELEAFAGKTVLVTEPVAQKLSGTKTSQDVFGVFEHPGWQAADILAKGRRILALEAVQDPGNVGTLLRSAAAFGFDGVLLSKGCAAPFAPKTLRASMGAAGRLPVAPVQDLPQLVARLTAGMAVLLLEGCSSGIVFSAQGLKFRSVEEPSGEGNLRGSREGFTDLLRVNLSLLRRLVRTDTLMQEAAQAHTCCNTEYALCYCKDRADPAMVRRVRAILQSARPELLLDSSYFVPWLLPGKARLFTPVHYTERPAVAAAKLCEGKLVILVNGSPSALVLPALFSEQFECLDDYASTAAFSSFLRVLKYFSFYLTVFLPGAFVCVAVHLPELLPPQLLYKIEAAEKATPLPLFAEMLLVILILEIIREAGLRMPQSLGHSVSLVSALIIGDAAIATGLMSTPVIFVASITAIAVFVTPGLYEPATLLRIGTVLLAGLAGPVGLAAAFFGFLLSIVSTEALGVSYLAPHPFPQQPLSEDGVLRRNYRQLSRHGFNIWQKRERGRKQS